MESKRILNESTYKTETHSQTQRANLWLPKGKGMDYEFGINRYILPYIKQASSNDLLHETGNNIQYLVTTYSGNNLKKYMCN